jgi:hypothetical protein
MKLVFEDKTNAAEFVNDLTKTFPDVSVWITITEQGKYEVSFAPSATDGSSEDTDLLTAKFFSETQVNT